MEVYCDFKYPLRDVLQDALIPDDWVISHDHFHFTLFPSDFNDLWGSFRVEGCSGVRIPPAQAYSKMDRWRAWSLSWGQVRRGTETKSDRKWGGWGRERESKTEREKKGRAESEEDMDQSQVKSKAHSLWKHREETRVVTLNIRPYFPRKESSESRFLLLILYLIPLFAFVRLQKGTI